MRSRRGFLQNLLFGVGAVASARALSAQHEGHEGMAMPQPGPTVRTQARVPAEAAAPPVMVESPDLRQLPWRMDGNVKEFHLVAEPVKQEIFPGRVLDLWGYSGSAPGPTIQVNQGDRVRLVVDNHLPEPTTVHWHGLEVPVEMDGMPGISQDPIPPGGRFVYEFTVHQEGTYFYHSHGAMQEMMGMIGAFIIHPRQPHQPRVDRDFSIILQEYAVLPNSSIPNSMSMEFNWLTFNGKSAPATTPLVVRLGQRVRIRLINLGMDHHPIHLHGHQFYVTGSEGGRQPESTWAPGNTVLVGVAQARDIEFVASNPGDWMLHCHLPHHMMNQMASIVGPMTRRQGMPAGLGMPEGMGMLRQGSALAESSGPSLGRGMGFAAAAERPVSNSPLGAQAAMPQAMQHEGHDMSQLQVAENANAVPGFPQDAFMEGPMMSMDDRVAKPENHGLRPGWSGFMMGMMTYVRVLPPERYDEIMELRQRQGETQPPQPPAMPGMEHRHE